MHARGHNPNGEENWHRGCDYEGVRPLSNVGKPGPIPKVPNADLVRNY